MNAKKNSLKIILIAIAACFGILFSVLAVSCNYRAEWRTKAVYAGWLKESEYFTEGVDLEEYRENHKSDNAIDYGFDNDYTELKEKYQIDEIAGNGSELDKTFNLLAWVSDKILHDGSKRGDVEKEDAVHFLDYAYEKDFGINCRALAITLNDILHSVGIKSRTLYIMPKEPNTGDNHVTVNVFIEDLGKWIMVDPSYNAAFMDSDGNYLDNFELRTMIANEEEIIVKEGWHYNNQPYNLDAYITYLAKNLYWFQSTISNNASWTAIPDGFDLKQWNLEELKFQKHLKWISNEEYKQYKYQVENSSISTVNKELFMTVK